MKRITDKDRIDWLEKGHEVIALIAEDGKSVKFSSNFSDQNWTEFDSVRDAIDFAINSSKI